MASMVLPVHRLTPYLRVRVYANDRSVTIEDRRALLGCIPLRRRRIRLLPGELSSYRFRTVVRLDALAAAAATVAMIFLLHPPIAAIVGLALAGIYFVLLGMPNKAVRIERSDGRGFTIRFCRDYEFDFSVALTDVERRREAPGPHAPGRLAA
jgi:hypothetical protein